MKVKLFILASFVAALGAGFVGGLNWRPVEPQAQPQRPDGPRKGWLARELNLDEKQSQAVEKIWSEAWREAHKKREQEQKDTRKWRDDSIKALLTAENQAQFDTIMAEYQKRMAQTFDPGKGLEGAIAQTKALLTEEQFRKFEQLQKNRGGGPGFGGPGFSGGRRGGPERVGGERGATRPKGPDSNPGGK